MKQPRILSLSLLLAGTAVALFAQRQNPASWTLSPEAPTAAPGSTLLLRLQLQLAASWHMYSMTQPPPGPTGGPLPAVIKLADNPAIESFRLFEPPPVHTYDPNFQMDTESYSGNAVFLILAKIAASAPAGPLDIAAQMRYQLCNDRECLPPRRVEATTKVTVAAGAAAAPEIPSGFLEVVNGKALGAAPPAAPASAGSASATGLGSFLLVAFGFGLAAIFTPCVFPMIPITVSFFLNQDSKGRSGSLFQATLFSLGIVILFTGLGLVTTAILGPFGVVQLGSNPWVNGFIALVFLVFGLSLLGAFEITLPSSLLTKLDSASRRGGIVGTLLMGLTFSLTAFACVGPFVGTLLAASVTGDRLTPVLGMLAFATGLAAPFFLLALFPGYLKRLPKSGGWMTRVKVVLGFIILAAMLKYASNIDQVLQWNFLTRERFLGAWIVLFAMPGLYLLGMLRMEGIKPDEKAGVGRVIAGCVFLIFSLSLLPGMFGARLGELDAYVPPPGQGSISSSAGAGPASNLVWMKNQYDAAREKARAENKLVFVNFTGYACTNCHWMRANMFTRPEISAALDNFVLVELYTDGTDAASEQNQKMQDRLFETVAIPFYAIVNPDGKVLASFAGLTRDPQEFLAFLDKAKTAS